MSHKLKPLGSLIHDFDIDEVVLEEKTNSRSLAQIKNDQNISGRQRAALELVSQPLAFGDVRDEQGKKRFHGAFTGGFSAGYFNTVGSKEGWKPKQFKSTRGVRTIGVTQRISDIADEEDLEGLRGNRALIDYDLGDIRDIRADKRGLSILDMPVEDLSHAAEILRIITTIANPSTGIGCKLLNRLRGFTKGCSRVCPDDMTFQSLLCRRRIRVAVKPRKYGPVMPPEMCKALGRKVEDNPDDLNESLRNCTEMTAASLQSLIRVFRNPKVDFGGVGASNGSPALFAIESTSGDRAAMLRIEYTTSLLPVPDMVPRPRLMANAHMVTEQMPGEGHRRTNAIVPMNSFRRREGEGPTVTREKEKSGGRGLRQIGLGVFNKYHAESDEDEDGSDAGEYNFEIAGDEETGNQVLAAEPELDPLVEMQQKIARIEASKSCIPGFCHAMDPLVTRGTNWFDLAARLNMRAPRDWQPRRRLAEGPSHEKIGTQQEPLTLWKGAAELKEQLMNRFAVSVGTVAAKPATGSGDPKLFMITKRFKCQWRPSALLCEILGFSGPPPEAKIQDDRQMKLGLISFLNDLKATPGYVPQFKFPEITTTPAHMGTTPICPSPAVCVETVAAEKPSADYSSLFEIYDYLRHTFMGYPDKQAELCSAVSQLQSRSENADIDHVVVNTTDLLYRLYSEALRENPHRYEAVLGGVRCVIETNCGLESAAAVVLFLHGMGSSPWHFVRVSSVFYADAASVAGGGDIPGVTYIFPFGTCRMSDTEFGALQGSQYGCYKWWDLFGSEAIDRENEKTPTPGGSRHFATYSPQPTVIFKAVPTPKVRGDSSPLSPVMEFQSKLKNSDDSVPTNPGTPVAVSRREVVTHGPSCPLSPVAAVTPMQTGICCCMTGNIMKSKFLQSGEDGPEDDAAGVRRSSSGKVFGLDNPKGRKESNAAMRKLMKTLELKYRIPMSKIVICGFSQGAMLAIDLFYALDKPPAMVGIFSGAPMCLNKWVDSAKKWPDQHKAAMTRVPIFHAHGINDWVFPIFVGRWLARFLRRQNLCINSLEFDGEHELTETVLYEFNKALYQVIITGSEQTPQGFTTVENNPKLMDTVDKMLYGLGYALAACVLPIARRIC